MMIVEGYFGGAIASVAARKYIEHRLIPLAVGLGMQTKHLTAADQAATRGRSARCAVEVAFLIERKVAARFCSIGAIGLAAKRVEDAEGPGRAGRQLKNGYLIDSIKHASRA